VERKRKIFVAMRKGEPMRAIDADHLRRWILSRVFKTQLSVADVIDQIDREDTIEPERKKGKWIRKSAGDWMWTCSYCGKDDAYAYSADDAHEPTVLQDFFCPNCGADMRGEQDE